MVHLALHVAELGQDEVGGLLFGLVHREGLTLVGVASPLGIDPVLLVLAVLLSQLVVGVHLLQLFFGDEGVDVLHDVIDGSGGSRVVIQKEYLYRRPYMNSSSGMR